MKYIKKVTTPIFFTNDTAGKTNWKEFKNGSKKKRLKEYILKNEQHYLCCYCEKKISSDKSSSHLEHIKPKSLDKLTLTFDYSNILVSCEGNTFNDPGDKRKNTCGHKKNNSFESGKFLNPTLEKSIHEFFKFDSDNGEISPSDKDVDKARYTLTILNLNGKKNKIAEARMIAKNMFISNVLKLPESERKTIVTKFLNDDSNQFITFFRYVFRNLKL